MDTFVYKAIDEGGRIYTGDMESNSESDVLSLLQSRNQFAITIEKKEKKSFLSRDIKIGTGVKTLDLVTFCRQLSAMLKAGMPLDRALFTQQAQTENPAMREAIANLSAQIKKGLVMSSAMAEQPKIFPEIFVRAVEAGEKTGDLDEALLRMATHFHKMLVLTRKVKGAMMYPGVVLIITFLMATFMVVWMIPQFAGFLEAAGGELPGLTMFFVNLSDSVREFWYFYIAGIAAIIVSVKVLLGSAKGQLKFDTLKLVLPKVGRLVKEIMTAKFTRTFSSMIASGVTIVEALEISAESMNNSYAEKRVLNIVEEIKKGSSVSDQLRSTGVFPEMMISMLTVGEETGQIDEMLIKVADYYDEESAAALDKLLAIIGPVMILLVAGVVGTIVVAMYLPIFDAMVAM